MQAHKRTTGVANLVGKVLKKKITRQGVKIEDELTSKFVSEYVVSSRVGVTI